MPLLSQGQKIKPVVKLCLDLLILKFTSPESTTLIGVSLSGIGVSIQSSTVAKGVWVAGKAPVILQYPCLELCPGHRGGPGRTECFQPLGWPCCSLDPTSTYAWQGSEKDGLLSRQHARSWGKAGAEKSTLSFRQSLPARTRTQALTFEEAKKLGQKLRLTTTLQGARASRQVFQGNTRLLNGDKGQQVGTSARSQVA